MRPSKERPQAVCPVVPDDIHRRRHCRHSYRRRNFHQMVSEPTRRRSRSGGRDIATPQPGWTYFAEAQVVDRGQSAESRASARRRPNAFVEGIQEERQGNEESRGSSNGKGSFFVVYVRVDIEADVNEILRDLRTHGLTVVLMLCYNDAAAEV